MDFNKFVSCNEEIEEWQTVTMERGHWATLYNNLEKLVHLCNLIGPEALKTLPSVPFDDITEDSRDFYTVDPTKLKLQFYDRG